MKTKLQGLLADQGYTYVQWALGNYCNYKCSYCKPIYNAGNRPYVEAQVFRAVLTKFHGKFNKIYWLFTGGEPTAHPQFEELLDIAAEFPNCYIGLISNGSRSPAWYSKVLPKLRGKSTLTCHSEYVDFAKFLEVVAVFGDRLSKVHVTMLPAKWEQCVAQVEALRALKVRVVPKLLWDDFGQNSGAINKLLPQYTPYQLAYVKKHAEDIKSITVYRGEEVVELVSPTQLIETRRTNYVGWQCNAGIESFSIGSSGNIYKAACGIDEVIGRVPAIDDLVFPSAPVTCNRPVCWCLSDLAITKESLTQTELG